MANKITAENLLAGNPRDQWDIVNEGVWTIEGFATQISYGAGETVAFKIDTPSIDYRIDIYRLGYYGGAGARRVHTIQVQLPAPQMQDDPIKDSTTGLVDAGNWTVSANWPIPVGAVSGIYIAKLVRQDSVPGTNHIPFILRDDTGQSDILFQTSDTTWQAYNSWGGASLYGGDGPGTDPATAGRAYKVSYNRPFNTRFGPFHSGAQDWIFGVEHPALMWLEKNGYDVSYISGVDSSRTGALLLDHKVFLSVGHDEYWSGEQRENVETARDQGVNLAFWSGNEVYWRTRWEPSISVPATPYRTLVCYKETRARADIDPTNQWTGTYRDPRFAGPAAIGAGQPENALTGTIFTVDSYRLDAIEIPYAYSRMRLWRNTSIANLLPGQTATLPAGYLGYEWDSDLDNGFRPAGLINMSKTTVAVSTLLLDYGSTTGSGTAEHSLTLYKAPSGALIFGAGTVYWAWGLDANHDLEQVPTDQRVQQAMVNLLADMEVQPASLVAPLTLATASSDVTPPASVINAPSGPLSPGQPYTISGTASDPDGVVGGVEVSTDDGTTWHKAEGRENWSFVWTPSIGGNYTVRSRAADDSGNIELPGPGVGFTVDGPVGVSLFGQYDAPLPLPADDPSSVELGMKFIPAVNGRVLGVRFYKVATNVGLHSGTLWSSGGVELATVTLAGETAEGWQTALFSQPVPVTAGQTYIASYHSEGFYGANDFGFYSDVIRGPLKAPSSGVSGGNGVYELGPRAFPTRTFNATNYWVDVLFEQPSVTPTPPDAVSDGPFLTLKNTPLLLTFATLLANDIDANGDPLTVTGVSAPANGTVSLDAPNGAVTFTPTVDFTGAAGFTYTIADGQGGVDTASVTIAVRAPASGSGVFASNAVPASSANDATPVELGMKFTPSVNGTITGIRFYKSPQNVGPHSARLWSLAGVELGSLTYSDETASGWQVGTLIEPIPVTAGTTYSVSYHSNGAYSADATYFVTAVVNGPLTAPSNAASAGNGIYKYGSAGSFPDASYNATNYWVDVLFEPNAGTNQPPVAQDDGGFVTEINTPLQIATAVLLANDSDPENHGLTVTSVSAAVSGTVALAGSGTMITFTPASNFVGNASFIYTISDGHGGSDSATVTISVVPLLFGTGVFAVDAVPDMISVNDPQAVELGMKFTTSTSGVIKGARFYKGPQNIGTHAATLWDTSGVPLRSVVFSAETSSGWQSAAFSSPVPVVTGQTYTISYHTQGNYSASPNYFDTSRTNGPLTAPSSAAGAGNGVFAYGSSAFPTGSFNATNYWIDVYFE